MISKNLGRVCFLAACGVLVGATVMVAGHLTPSVETLDESTAYGHVVDEAGRPVTGAQVTTPSRTVETDESGEFRLPAERGVAELVSVTAPGYLDRSQLFDPDSSNWISLTRHTNDSLSLRFGGDVMMGRRYYSSADADRRPLQPGASAAEHAALLEHVKPLLEDADVTVVNLETPLLDDPYFDPEGPRPENFHPTKALAFGSAVETAEALRLSGVDVVALGNNHVYDALGPGLDGTLAAVEAAGLAHFGAGRTPDEAWRPAVVERPGGSVAFIGCTTVAGNRHPIRYVADDVQGGSAECEVDRLTAEIESARATAGRVVVMIHGGVEYQRAQTNEVRELSLAAREAGASAVVNSHPHVVGGISGGPGTVEVESTGNLTFDQDLWDTFPSYIVRTDLHGSSVVNTTIDPIVLDGYIPRPASGLVADRIARIAAGTVPNGPHLTPSGIHGGRVDAAPHTVGVDSPEPTVARIGPGWWLSSIDAGAVRAGVDQLNGTGSFGAAGTAQGRTSGLWSTKEHAKLTHAASCTQEPSDLGLEMVRSPLSAEELVSSPKHRAKLEPGTELSFMFDVRFATTGASAALHWYREQAGESMGVTTFEIPEVSTGSDCRSIRFDVRVPEGATAVLPHFRLVATAGEQSGQRLAIDNASLVAWAPVGEVGKRFDTVDAPAASRYTLTNDLTSDMPLWDEPRTFGAR